MGKVTHIWRHAMLAAMTRCGYVGAKITKLDNGQYLATWRTPADWSIQHKATFAYSDGRINTADSDLACINYSLAAMRVTGEIP